MPSSISSVTDGGGKFAHQNLMIAIRDFAVANGWTLLRYDDTQTYPELILRGPGLSGSEEVFVGFITYESVGNDYYNLGVFAMTGYVASNLIWQQPGLNFSAVPCHNTRIDYWLAVNGQRIVCAMKVGTPVYETFYLGKMFPYATPGQYPYPIVCAGMLDGTPPTRFSDPNYAMPYLGTRPNMRLRWLDGTWLTPQCWPYNCNAIAGAPGSSTRAVMRDTGGSYPLLPVTLMGDQGILGELDGVAWISGFDNAVENTLSISGETWVVMQDVSRTAFASYFALRLS